MNYKEAPRGASEQERTQYSAGIQRVNGFVGDLQKKGLLPERWTPQGEAQRAIEQPLYMIPEGTGIRFTQEVGGKTPQQLEDEVKATGREVTLYASYLIHSPEFEVLEGAVLQEFLRLPVSALGLSGAPTFRRIFNRIPQCRLGEEYALEHPRAEVGPHRAIADEDQAKGDFYSVIHKPIADRRGPPGVFRVAHASHGRFLHGAWALPAIGWHPDIQLVVALRKIEPVKP